MARWNPHSRPEDYPTRKSPSYLQGYAELTAITAITGEAMHRDIGNEIARHEQAIEKLTEEQAKVLRFGNDDWPDETVLYFKKVFNDDWRDNPTAYTYLAFKIKGGWYLSGRSGARLSWASLVDFMKDTDELWVVEHWVQVF